MGKIVQFCSSCDEGFAEKFGFCPNCGQTLQSFEMNPVVVEAPAIQAPPVTEQITAAPVPEGIEEAEKYKTYIEPAQQSASAFETVESFGPIEPAEEPIAAQPVIEEPVAAQVAQPAEETVIEEPVVRTASPRAATATAAPTFAFAKTFDADRKPRSLEEAHSAALAEGGFYVTVIEEKNVGQRNALLAGAFAFMLFSLMTGLVYNIFSKELEVGSINDDIFNAVIVDNVPMTVEEEKQQKKEKDAGGGGGGGRQEEETTLGDLANQTKHPERPPEAIPRLDNPLVLPPASTERNKTFQPTHERFRDPTGRFTNWNNGSGSGGGQGSGSGTGQGSGRGTGAGSGDGSGYGGGLGNGNGNGSGTGNGGFPPPPPRIAGVTTGIKILSKPRPGYTDAARTANIQGTVILRVVF